MRYCAGCGKQINTDRFLKVGKLAYHYRCAPVEDAPIAPVIPIRSTERNRDHLKMLHELAALLSLTNATPMVIVPCKPEK